ncbi:Protein T2 [Nowakowskiella sp. JEL0407]|nr:Protein T2 [Nowakowskiella sp. JEL0407]
MSSFLNFSSAQQQQYQAYQNAPKASWNPPLSDSSEALLNAPVIERIQNRMEKFSEESGKLNNQVKSHQRSRSISMSSSSSGTNNIPTMFNNVTQPGPQSVNSNNRLSQMSPVIEYDSPIGYFPPRRLSRPSREVLRASDQPARRQTTTGTMSTNWSSSTAHLPTTFENEFQPEYSLTPPLLKSPLYSADVIITLIPHLIDSLAGRVPEDSWNWETVEIGVSGGNEGMKKEKRYYVIQHMLETEQNYLDDLKLIIGFRKRLLDDDIMSPMSAKIVFEGIDELFEIHTRFLADMEAAIHQGEQTPISMTRAGRLFLASKDVLVQVYSKFIAGYSLSQTEIRTLGKKPEFEKFSEEVRKTLRTKELKDILVAPVQRTTRYQLLLTDLQKCTPLDHPDRHDLDLAFDAMKDLANQVNQRKKQEEEKTGLFEAFNSTSNCPIQLINARRRMVVQYDVVEIREKKPYRIAVCSDLIMITQSVRGVKIKKDKEEAGNVKPFRFICWMDLREVTVEDLRNTEDYYSGNIFRISQYPLNIPNNLTKFEPDVSNYRPTGTEWTFKVEDIGEFKKIVSEIKNCKLNWEMEEQTA